MGDYQLPGPVEVSIKNWSDAPKPKTHVKKTTVKTWILDPTGAAGPKNAQICEYEPNRVRLAIRVIDQDVALLLEPPSAISDTSANNKAPQGLYLPAAFDAARASFVVIEFFGPDAMWINPLAGTTRVTVIKEYC